jgi:hypothetical protein
MNRLDKLVFIFPYLATIVICQPSRAQSSEVIVGNMRIQALSENLVRIEQRGPNGFEDRNTFTVVDRNWAGETIMMQELDNQTILTTTKCRIVLPKNCRSLAGIPRDPLPRFLPGTC